jgi:hypothetical protein
MFQHPAYHASNAASVPTLAASLLQQVHGITRVNVHPGAAAGDFVARRLLDSRAGIQQIIHIDASQQMLDLAKVCA